MSEAVVQDLSYEALTQRLAVAEQTLDAIQRGEVDALVVAVDGHHRVYALEGADAFYRALVEQMPEGAAAVSASGRVLYANSRCAEMLGLPLEQVIATDLPQWVEPRQRRRLRAALLRVGGQAESLDLTLIGREGSAHPVLMSVCRVVATAPATEDVLCVLIVEQTQQTAPELAAQEADARFRGAFDHAPIGMAIVGLDGRLQQVNAALCQITGSRRSDLLGHELAVWVEDPEPVVAALGRLIAEGTDVVVLACRTTAGKPAALHLSLVRGVGGHVVHVIAQVKDESEREEHEVALRATAEHDGLTGLLNRRGFEARLATHLTLVSRGGAPGSLVLLDVDHFKHVNDTWGHQAGDAVLVELARHLRGRLRSTDTVARLGGDEFAVLLPHDDLAGAGKVAQDLVRAARDIRVPGAPAHSRRLTISAGVAQLREGDGASDLMATADGAMYLAKAAGRDRHEVAGAAGPGSPGHEPGDYLRRIEAALASDGLLLAAQPIFRVGRSLPARHEVLLRLPGADGPVPAAQWFPLAERYGLAPALDDWVLGKALAMMRAQPSLRLNVNVSALSIVRPSWTDAVRAGLQRTSLEPGRLTLEITETAAIDDLDATVGFADALRSMGCRLSLDDFGAGFASFAYLKHLPFDEIKIDGQFVRDSVRDVRDRAIISGMVSVARALGRETVAEWVEDAETLQLVRDHGVDLLQGFHLGRPAPLSLPG